MADLTPEHFTNTVRQNPDDELTRQIYADWLEEQGDERSRLIRLFDRAAHDCDSPESQELLKHLDGSRYGFPVKLPDNQALLAALNFIWFCGDLDDDLILILSEIHSYTTGGGADQESVTDTVPGYLWSVTETPLIRAVTSLALELEDCQTSFYHVTYFTRRSGRISQLSQYLIVLSYHLFGTNVFPWAFERSEHA